MCNETMLGFDCNEITAQVKHDRNLEPCIRHIH